MCGFRFWSMIAAAGDRKHDILKVIIPLAQSKLLCRNEIDVSYNEAGNEAALAVVDLRLMLNYEARREKARLHEVNLVSSNMRTAITVPPNREYFVSSYCSEPVLAEVAARQMYIFLMKDCNATLEILTRNVQSGLLN